VQFRVYFNYLLKHTQRTLYTIYPRSAVDERVAVKQQLDHVGASPLAGHVQRTDGILQQRHSTSHSFSQLTAFTNHVKSKDAYNTARKHVRHCGRPC